MTDITGYELGWKTETTYGTRVRASPTTNTQVYSVGSITRALPTIPIEEKEWTAIPVFNSYNPTKYVVGKKFMPFAYECAILEGVRFYHFLGEESKSGAGPTYTHTLTETEPADDAVLPSSSFHLQSSGLTTQLSLDMCGMVSQRMELMWLNTRPSYLGCTETLLGQRMTTNESAYSSYDLDGTADADSSEKAVVYTNSPTTVDSSLALTEQFRCTEVKLGGSGGTNYISDIQAVQIIMNNDFDIPAGYWNRDGTDNYGRNINHYPGNYLLASRDYQIALTYKWTDATQIFFKDLQQEVMDTDLYIKFERTHDGNTHSLAFTWNESYSPCTIIKGPFLHHAPDENKTAIFKPIGLDATDGLISIDEISEVYSTGTFS